MVMKLALGLAVTIGMLAATPLPAMAQANSTAEQLIQGLEIKPNAAGAGGLSRGVKLGRGVEVSGTAGLSSDQANRVSRSVQLGRSVEIEEVREVAEIIEHSELPYIDFTIEFEFNSATLTPSAMATLVTLGEALRDERLSKSRFLLAGHTDSKGSNEYNLGLSQDRAYAVERFLVGVLHVDGDILQTLGLGEEQLKNRDYPEAAENRRVTVVNLGY
jgi:outer membrane protein OmpA-like peptidoglycan-associated protein